MKREVIVKFIGEERQGVSKQTGQPWQMTDVIISWTEETQNGPTESDLVISLNKKVNRQKLQQAVSGAVKMDAYFYFTAIIRDGKCYNHVRGFLPKEYYDEQGN